VIFVLKLTPADAAEKKDIQDEILHVWKRTRYFYSSTSMYLLAPEARGTGIF
jgi:hypothetical protein